MVNVEFICTDGRSLTEEDVSCLNHVARGIEMSAKIVDTPCNEMHTDAFLDVCRLSSDLSESLNLIIVLFPFSSSSGRLERACLSVQ